MKLSRIQVKRLTQSVPHAVTRLFREQNRLHGRAVEPFGVSAEQAHLLTLLWVWGPLSMGELGRLAALSTGTLSTAVDRMEAAGLVERSKRSVDQRSVTVEAKGWPPAKQARLVEALISTEDAMLKPLSARERTVLHGLLERVLAGHP
jgi:DNA-binding MarR family transcriptional regulator